MKLYNPFKPHIVEYDGWYYVRRLTFIGYEHMDRNELYWWYVPELVDRYCKCSLEEAKENLKRKSPKARVVFP